MEVAVVSLNYLERPPGVAYDFVFTLVDSCDGFGDGRAFGRFLKDDVLQLVEEYVEDNSMDSAARQQILTWVNGLPFEDGFVSLSFG